MDRTSLYPRHIAEHARSSPYRNRNISSAHHAVVRHPSCGDTLTVYVHVHEGIVKDIGFDGSGCMISQAAASLYVAHIHGKKISEISSIASEEVIHLLQISIGSARKGCVLLVYQAVRDVLHLR